MSKVAWLVKADGSIKEVKPKKGKTFTLEELQGFVGGNVEVISLPNGKELWLNEEGKLDNLPINEKLSTLWFFLFAGYDLGADDFVVGDCLYCDTDFTK